MITKDTVKKDYQDKKILILGLGLNRGGLGAARFFAEAEAQVIVTDLKAEEELAPILKELEGFKNISYTLGEHKYSDLDWADLIIRNPAIKPDNKYLLYAQEKGKAVEMDFGIFLKYVKREQIIGVTGTKGKSTTSSLIYEVLSKCKLNKEYEILFAGNIGKSVLDTISYVRENSLVILELSSFQLQAFEQHHISPKYALITNIYPDHINYHGSMESYIEAKRAITNSQDKEDLLFIKRGDEITDTEKFLEGLKARVERFGADDLPAEFKPLLPGVHNRDNFAAALAVSRVFGVDADEALRVMESFAGVDFRLQFIKTWNGVKIYNDSAATNPKSTVEALKSLPGVILITGGMDKDIAFDQMSEAIVKYAKEIYFIEGTATDKIIASIKDKAEEKIKGVFNNFEEILEKIKASGVGEGAVILFSPGATSFNFWQNEFDRGRKFNLAVEKVFND